MTSRRAARAIAASGLIALAIATTPSTAADRAAAPVAGTSELAGTSLIVIAAGLAVILIGSFIILDDEDEPLSV